MIKIFVLCAIVVLTTLIGLLLANEKKKAMKIMKEFYDFNEKMMLSLPFDRKPVKECAENFPYVKKKLGGEKLLKGEYEVFLTEYAQFIGKSNQASQQEFLAERKQQLKKYADETKVNYEKYGPLYVKLFFLAGVLFAVVFA